MECRPPREPEYRYRTTRRPSGKLRLNTQAPNQVTPDGIRNSPCHFLKYFYVMLKPHKPSDFHRAAADHNCISRNAFRRMIVYHL